MSILNRKLDHINLNVPNLEEAIKFYTEVLGFEIVNRFKSDMEFVFITDGTITYELVENPLLDATTIEHIAYVSSDIQKDFDHFKKLGLVTTNLSYLSFMFENGVYYFFIKGAGNEKIEFCQKKEV
ncbi:hypothetical protein AN640_05445 [Candidatus Epulonipiscium fishelsonii]|uniref:Uncharacterized protein n=1 Tax=Candidatus Epulonipiscium fishelsonii TaxID=77094 RepID=A0ACC8XHY1_9FIRM|nr:hypothetical protein AN640_05445 [Epulopiscium sp. SCG-D08WGA-EpuloA1]